MSYTSPNRTWIVGETVTAAIMNQYVRDQLNSIGRLGKYDYIIAATAGINVLNIIDVGWAECNGATFTRATYPEFDALLSGLSPARPFGNGNGTTTTTLPDLFGRVPVGLGSHADVNALGDQDGISAAFRTPKHNSTHALTLPNHTHTTDIGYAGLSGVGTGPPSWLQNQQTSPGGANSGVFSPGSSNPTSLPVVGGFIGPGDSRPPDMPAYEVAGIWVVKIKP